MRLNKPDLFYMLYIAGYKKQELKQQLLEDLIWIVIARQKHRADEKLLENARYSRDGDAQVKYGQPRREHNAAADAEELAAKGITHFTCLQTYSKADARLHLAALKHYLSGDASATSGSTEPINEGTDVDSTHKYIEIDINSAMRLCHDNGNLVFSVKAQILIAGILHDRQLIYVGPKKRLRKNAFAEAARIRYAEACGTLMRTIESQVGGLPRARKLVDEAFGISGDGDGTKKKENGAESSNDEDDWEEEEKGALDKEGEEPSVT